MKFIDGFFNFLVGILIAALTENWQRLGDMAARTVVVRAPKALAHQEVPIASPMTPELGPTRDANRSDAIHAPIDCVRLSYTMGGSGCG